MQLENIEGTSSELRRAMYMFADILSRTHTFVTRCVQTAVVIFTTAATSVPI